MSGSRSTMKRLRHTAERGLKYPIPSFKYSTTCLTEYHFVDGLTGIKQLEIKFHFHSSSQAGQITPTATLLWIDTHQHHNMSSACFAVHLLSPHILLYSMLLSPLSETCHALQRQNCQFSASQSLSVKYQF